MGIKEIELGIRFADGSDIKISDLADVLENTHIKRVGLDYREIRRFLRHSRLGLIIHLDNGTIDFVPIR